MKGSGRFLFKTIETAILLSVGFILMVPYAAHAHRVNVFAWVEGETVHTESSFPGGGAVKGGRISVYDDRTGEKLLEGKTDDRGAFSFPVPRRKDLRIELTAGMGHKNKWIVRAEEISGAAAIQPAAAAGKDAEVSPESKATDPAGAPEAVSTARIEAAVEKVLDRKLAPVKKELAELRRRRTDAADIFGGIGYIIGLAGLGAYLHYRRKRKELEGR